MSTNEAPKGGNGSPAPQPAVNYLTVEKPVHRDPLAILAALMTADVDWETDLRLMMSDPNPDDPPEGRAMIIRASFDSLRRIVAAIRGAFGIKPTVEGGLMDAECLDLRAKFVGWLMELKKKDSGTPTLPSPSRAVWGPSPTTPSTSPSRSTSPAPCTGPPTSLPPESPGP